MMPENKINKTYTTVEFAKRIGVGANTVRRWDRRGKLRPAFRLAGGYRRYTEEQAVQFEKECAERVQTWSEDHNWVNE